MLRIIYSRRRLQVLPSLPLMGHPGKAVCLYHRDGGAVKNMPIPIIILMSEVDCYVRFNTPSHDQPG